MRRDDRLRYSEQAAESIIGLSRAQWSEQDAQTFYTIDEALVAALKEQRRQIAEYLQREGYPRLAEAVREGRL